MKIIVGSDHAGFNFKEMILACLDEHGHTVSDAGPEDKSSCDYPDYAFKVARAVANGQFDRGVLICGTGLGMSYAANRVKGVRAALCMNEYQARMSRAHNNANILVLGERAVGPDVALSMLEVWLETEFEGGRHQRRVELFDQVDG
ncbi:MAG: ribose 5-phosphate isomerase B [Deltaproteobacteria bacterium]|nr:ribose 5-phosphate isomerase B [Deltaproteobacteria bacterium]